MLLLDDFAEIQDGSFLLLGLFCVHTKEKEGKGDTWRIGIHETVFLLGVSRAIWNVIKQ